MGSHSLIIAYKTGYARDYTTSQSAVNPLISMGIMFQKDAFPLFSNSLCMHKRFLFPQRFTTGVHAHKWLLTVVLILNSDYLKWGSSYLQIVISPNQCGKLILAYQPQWSCSAWLPFLLHLKKLKRNKNCPKVMYENITWNVALLINV